jgi:hypothetical protein
MVASDKERHEHILSGQTVSLCVKVRMIRSDALLDPGSTDWTYIIQLSAAGHADRQVPARNLSQQKNERWWD